MWYAIEGYDGEDVLARIALLRSSLDEMEAELIQGKRT